MPLGVNTFLKSGSFTGPPEAVHAVAGELFTAKRWVCFAALFNWLLPWAGQMAAPWPPSPAQNPVCCAGVVAALLPYREVWQLRQ